METTTGRRFGRLVTAVPLALAVACGPAGEPVAERKAPPAPAGSSPAAIERAREAAMALSGELSNRLVQELQAGGPLQAVRVCSEVAQQVAAERSAPGLVVRRVSLKLRNPADAPDDWERQQLEALEARHRAGQPVPPEVAEKQVQDGTPRIRFLRPIFVQQPCLACHGEEESMDPAVRELLRQRYPDDRATGYLEGDLRGAVSVIADI